MTMADDTVFANGQSVATLGTDHVAVNREEKDEILIPPKKDRKRTLNIAHMPALKEGSARTFYAGSPVWTMAGFLLESEEYPLSPPGSVGMKTQKPYRGSAIPMQGSPNVFVEGQSVIRYQDPTQQDSGNSKGVVLKRGDLDALKKALDEEHKKQDGDGETDKKKGRRWGDVPRTEEDIDVEPPPEPAVTPPVVPPDARCTLEKVSMKCSHGRAAGGTKTQYLEVVTDDSAEDAITSEITVINACGATVHPALVVKNAGDLTVTGSPATFPAKNRAPESSDNGMSLTFLVQVAKIIKLLRMAPKQYDLTVNACSGQQQLNVYSYPSDEVSAKLELDWLETAVEPLEMLFELITGAELDLKLAVGSIEITAEWKEEKKSHRAACELVVDLGLAPLIGAQVDVPIRIPGPLMWVQQALEKVLKWFAGAQLQFFFTLKGQLDVVTVLKAKFWRTTRPTVTAAGRKIKASFRAGVGLKCVLFKEVVKFRSDLTAGASIEASFLGSGEGFDMQLGMVLGDIKGLIEFEIDLGKIPFIGGGVKAVGDGLSWIASKVSGKPKDLDISQTSYSKEITVWDGIPWDPAPIRLFPRT
jgi:hypothetical protein